MANRINLAGTTNGGYGAVSAARGSATTPSHNFWDAPSIGIYTDSSNLLISVGGAEKVKFGSINATYSTDILINKPVGGTGLTVSTSSSEEVEVVLRRIAPALIPSQWEMYIPVGSTDLRWYNNSNDRLIISSIGNLKTRNGVQALPSHSFIDDPDTGMYRSGDNSLSFATEGLKRLEIGTSAIDSTISLRGPLGTQGAPTFSFANDSNTGMYHSGDNTLSFTTQAIKKLEIGTSAINSTISLRGPYGASYAPTFSFANDSNTGMYHHPVNPNTIHWSTAGSLRLTLTSAALASTVNITAPAIDLSSGGPFKVKILTVGTSSLNSGSITVAHGLSNVSNVRGISAGAVDTFFESFLGTNASSFTQVDLDQAGTGLARITWTGLGGNLKKFYMTIFYQ